MAALQRIDGAGELDQRAIAGQLDQPAAMPGQCGLEPLGAMVPQARQRAALVPAHQAGVADHIGRNDGRQSALLTGQWNSSLPRIVEGLNRLGNDAADVARPCRLLARNGG